MADHAIRVGQARIVVAGGMENMTRAPHLMEKARQGYRLGHAELTDSYRRACHAIATGAFKPETVPVEVPQRKGPPITVTEEEEPNRVELAKVRQLKPAFQEAGILTVDNSPSCNEEEKPWRS